jgi:hypothetical protein
VSVTFCRRSDAIRHHSNKQAEQSRGTKRNCNAIITSYWQLLLLAAAAAATGCCRCRYWLELLAHTCPLSVYIPAPRGVGKVGRGVGAGVGWEHRLKTGVRVRVPQRMRPQYARVGSRECSFLYYNCYHYWCHHLRAP